MKPIILFFFLTETKDPKEIETNHLPNLLEISICHLLTGFAVSSPGKHSLPMPLCAMGLCAIICTFICSICTITSLSTGASWKPISADPKTPHPALHPDLPCTTPRGWIHPITPCSASSSQFNPWGLPLVILGRGGCLWCISGGEAAIFCCSHYKMGSTCSSVPVPIPTRLGSWDCL